MVEDLPGIPKALGSMSSTMQKTYKATTLQGTEEVNNNKKNEP